MSLTVHNLFDFFVYQRIFIAIYDLLLLQFALRHTMFYFSVDHKYKIIQYFRKRNVKYLYAANYYYANTANGRRAQFASLV